MPDWISLGFCIWPAGHGLSTPDLSKTCREVEPCGSLLSAKGETLNETEVLQSLWSAKCSKNQGPCKTLKFLLVWFFGLIEKSCLYYGFYLEVT